MLHNNVRGASRVPAQYPFVIGLLFFGLAGGVSADDSLTDPETSGGLRSHTEAVQPGESPLTQTAASNDSEQKWATIRIERGDSLSEALDNRGYSARDWLGITRLDGKADRLEALQPGDVLRIQRRADGHLGALRLALSPREWLEVAHIANRFRTRVIQRALMRQVKNAGASIARTLYQAAANQNVPDAVIMQMSRLFGRKLDLSRQLHAGARFAVIYETLWRDGRQISAGPIIAAALRNRGQEYHVFRYPLPDGSAVYLDESGRRIQPALLRAPLDYRFISSPFDRARLHPVLKVVRPHLGVDYAAPAGTPIRAAGDGRVTFRGRQGGYGKVIYIRHNTRYQTIYSHMRGFAPGLAVGDRVEQDEIIGYVGQTGLTTGPHLHYAVKVGGQYRNPRALPVPRQQQLSENLRVDFRASMNRLLSRLEARVESTTVAER